MLTLKKIWHGLTFSLAAVLIASSMFVQVTNGETVTPAANVCTSAQSEILHPPDGEFGGVIPIEIHVDPLASGSTTNPVDKVTVFVDNTFIGQASQDTASTYVWRYEWNSETSSLPSNTDLELTAKVYSQGTVLCDTAPRIIRLINTNGGQPVDGTFFIKRKDPLVSSWLGPTNVSKRFVVEGRFTPDGQTTSNNVTSDTFFEWRLAPLDGSPIVGSLVGDRNKSDISFSSGPTPGRVKLIVDAEFMGKISTRTYELTVESSSTTNYPELDDDEVTTSINDTKEDDAGSADSGGDGSFEQISSEDLNETLTSDTELSGCLIDEVGRDTYQAIVNGEKRLTFSQLQEVRRCFAGTRYLLPANVAPIAPDLVRNVKENTRLAKVRDVLPARDFGLDQEGIVFSGQASEDAVVVVYIFSEPLVLTTSSDDEGNWTYILEDPLEPGEHEVLVAVEDEDGEPVRSAIFTFNVAQAASIDASNPSGLSLTLDLSDPQQNSTIYYVSAVAAAVLAGVGLYIFTIRRKPMIEEEKSAQAEANKDKSDDK